MSVWNLKNPAEAQAIQSLSTETDRGVAIIASTYLEDRLTQGLICKFRRDSGKARNMIDAIIGISGDHGTFGAKIKLGYLLRLYGKRVCTELDAIRDIRNQFAHILGESAILSFSHPDIVKLCGKLTLIELYARPMSEAPKDFAQDLQTRTTIDATRRSGMSFGDNNAELLANPRRRFTETCGLLAERFQNPSHQSDPELPDEFLILGDEPYPLP
jgi:hypothetical protein